MRTRAPHVLELVLLAILAAEAAAISGGGILPAGLPGSFSFGAPVKPCHVEWAVNGQVAMQYYVMEFGGPFGNDWTTYWDNKLPEEFFAMSSRMYGQPTPVIVLRSLLDNGAAAQGGLDALQDNVRAAKWWANWDELLRRIADYGHPVVVIVEPEIWGLAQRTASSPSLISAVVKSTTYGPAAATNRADTLAGFAMALTDRRNTLARNARLAVFFDHGASGIDLFGDITVTTVGELLTETDKTATWITALGTTWDMFVASPMDVDTRRVADADWGVLNEGHYHLWWDPVDSGDYSDVAPNSRSFLRTRLILRRFSASAGLRGLLWRVPVGNTYFSECNNDPGHYRDNKLEYFLPPGVPAGEAESVPGGGDTSHLDDWWDAGIIGVLVGAGEQGHQCTVSQYGLQKSVTSHLDFLNCPAASDCDSDKPASNRDGIRHPKFSTPGNSLQGWSHWGGHLAKYGDGDGGYTRIALRVYAGLDPYYVAPVDPEWYETWHGQLVIGLSALILLMCCGTWLKGVCCGRDDHRGWSMKAQEPGNRNGWRKRRRREAKHKQRPPGVYEDPDHGTEMPSRSRTPGMTHATSQTPLKVDSATLAAREAWIETEEEVLAQPKPHWRDRAQYVAATPEPQPRSPAMTGGGADDDGDDDAVVTSTTTVVRGGRSGGGRGSASHVEYERVAARTPRPY